MFKETNVVSLKRQMSLLKNYINDVLVPQPLSYSILQREGIKNIIMYNDLRKYKSIDQVLGKDKQAILLYQTTDEFNGHWVSIFKNKDGEIHYFDSYGKKPDYWIFHDNIYNKTPYLTALFKGKDVHYNTFPFQKSDSQVATCGRFAILRLRFKNLSDEKFIKLFSKRITLSPDELACLLI